jgi:hypothetical protein
MWHSLWEDNYDVNDLWQGSRTKCNKTKLKKYYRKASKEFVSRKEPFKMREHYLVANNRGWVVGWVQLSDRGEKKDIILEDITPWASPL